MEAVSTAQHDQGLDRFSADTERERWTRAQLLAYQAKALRACRDYAYAHSPFYQRFHQGLMDRPLHELPVLTKAMMLEHFDDLVTDRDVRLQDVQEYVARGDGSRRFLDRYQVLPTSGSTGNPAAFLYNRMEGVIRGKTLIRTSIWGGAKPQDRVATVTSSSPLVIDGQRVGQLHLPARSSVESLVEQLNEWQPEVLLGYSSINAVLAYEQREGRLKITPNIVFCAADTLTNEMRQQIEATWQKQVFSSYGTTEGGIMASECSAHQGMHLFEDFSILEVVDQKNRPVPPGEQGDKVLLTVLFRRTQPLIRYELTDLVRLSTVEQCACGRPFALLEAIEGRVIEVIYLPSPTGKEEPITPYMFHAVFDRVPVTGWQVILEPDGLHLFVTGARDDLRDESVIDAVRQDLVNRGVVAPPILLHRVTELTKNASGKTPLVISRVPRAAS